MLTFSHDGAIEIDLLYFQSPEKHTNSIRQFSGTKQHKAQNNDALRKGKQRELILSVSHSLSGEHFQAAMQEGLMKHVGQPPEAQTGGQEKFMLQMRRMERTPNTKSIRYVLRRYCFNTEPR